MTFRFNNYFGLYWPGFGSIKKFESRNYWNNTPLLHKEIMIVILWWNFQFIKTIEGKDGQSVFELV